MLENLVLATPTYNAAEYLSVFLNSCVCFAKTNPIVLVVDGSTDNTHLVIEEYSRVLNIRSIFFDKNKGQPIAYNTCMKEARDYFKSSFVLMLNDDFVLGPTWNNNLEKFLPSIDKDGFLLGLYYAWPGPDGYGAVSYLQGGKDPTKFDMGGWASFSSAYKAKAEMIGRSGFGPGFPFIFSTKMIDRYHFDEKFHTGGVLDTDFLFTLFLDGYPLERYASNLFFHFSGGATDKQKAMGVWIEHEDTFNKKWGISVATAMHAIIGIKEIPGPELSRLKELQNSYRFSII
jgi:glycosyltransferase involved in cell wall biosynthesis